jgi:hypothetical protein
MPLTCWDCGLLPIVESIYSRDNFSVSNFAETHPHTPIVSRILNIGTLPAHYPTSQLVSVTGKYIQNGRLEFQGYIILHSAVYTHLCFRYVSPRSRYAHVFRSNEDGDFGHSGHSAIWITCYMALKQADLMGRYRHWNRDSRSCFA